MINPLHQSSAFGEGAGGDSRKDKMPVENTVNLIEGKSFRVFAGADLDGLGARGCTVNFEDVLLGPQTNPTAKAIVEYIEDQVSSRVSNRRFDAILFHGTIDNEDSRTIIRVEMDNLFILELRQFLPGPFLLIKLQVGAVEPIFVEERIELGGRINDNGSTIIFRVSQFSVGEVHRRHISIENNPGENYEELSCTVSVDVGWTEEIQSIRVSVDPLMGKLAQDDSDMDLTLVAGNGAEIKCHRIIFAACSPAFSAMVSQRTGMVEAQTGRIQMRENSEEGLALLMHCLYGMELMLNDISGDLLVELFQTAHKYDLSQLEKSLLQFLLKKDPSGFTPGGLLELYFYVKNFDAEKMIRLQEHALSLLACVDKLGACEEFKRLGKADSSELMAKLLNPSVLLRRRQPIQKMRLSTDPLMQMLFEDESDKDLIIVAGNGAEIKCHKLIFAARAPVFSAMVSHNAGMKEGQAGRIDMSENSEQITRLLVQYVYGTEMIFTDISFHVILELFQAAHKYDLGLLEKSLVEWLLKKDENGFEPGDLLQLHFYAKTLGSEEMIKLREHTWNLLVFVKGLPTCEEFKKLNQTEALDLLSKLFKSAQKYIPRPWRRSGTE